MTKQNTSSAVMQQRQKARNALDDFPTPMWATRAVCEWLIAKGYLISNCDAREPCANRGYMVKALEEFFKSVLASDMHDYGAGYPVEDYLFGPLPDPIDWTVMNAPFRLNEQFIERALQTSKHGVAAFVRSAYLEGESRCQNLFAKSPPTYILQFAERVVIHKSQMRQAGSKYFDPDADKGKGAWKRSSSATAYMWLIWDMQIGNGDNRPAPKLHWIGPCRTKLEAPLDYMPLGDLA